MMKRSVGLPLEVVSWAWARGREGPRRWGERPPASARARVGAWAPPLRARGRPLGADESRSGGRGAPPPPTGCVGTRAPFHSAPRGRGVPHHLPTPRDASEGKGPQRGPQKRLGRPLEEVAKAVGGGYCRLQMPLRLALGFCGTVTADRLRAVEGGGSPSPHSNASLPTPLNLPPLDPRPLKIFSGPSATSAPFGRTNYLRRLRRFGTCQGHAACVGLHRVRVAQGQRWPGLTHGSAHFLPHPSCLISGTHANAPSEWTPIGGLRGPHVSTPHAAGAAAGWPAANCIRRSRDFPDRTRTRACDVRRCARDRRTVLPVAGTCVLPDRSAAVPLGRSLRVLAGRGVDTLPSHPIPPGMCQCGGCGTGSGGARPPNAAHQRCPAAPGIAPASGSASGACPMCHGPGGPRRFALWCGGGGGGGGRALLGTFFGGGSPSVVTANSTRTASVRPQPPASRFVTARTWPPAASTTASNRLCNRSRNPLHPPCPFKRSLAPGSGSHRRPHNVSGCQGVSGRGEAGAGRLVHGDMQNGRERLIGPLSPHTCAVTDPAPPVPYRPRRRSGAGLCRSALSAGLQGPRDGTGKRDLGSREGGCPDAT